ncbi:MAG: heme exporter protein CcmD [Gammaproteobacteria bacterium]
MSEFFAMGGYAIFLWPAYFATFLAIGANIVLARRAHEEAKREARRRIAIEDDTSP